MRLLATKHLAPSFRDRLIQHGFSIIEQPFIQIQELPFQKKEIHNNLIFTSQNAVKIAFSKEEITTQIQGRKYYCVGEKTKTLIEKNGQIVIKMSPNAAELVQFLIKKGQNEQFSFFCGKLRRPEIETQLFENKIEFNTHKIYDTLITPVEINKVFDGVLFFSPSAVISYFKSNTWNSETHGFCIGNTTAAELAKHTKNFSVAKEPTDAQLLLSIHNYYTQHHAQK